MKLELIREVKLNGDIFYFIEKDGRHLEDSIVYGGNLEDGEKTGAYEKARGFYNICRTTPSEDRFGKKVIISEELFGDKEENL
jgi:hypothetical protein